MMQPMGCRVLVLSLVASALVHCSRHIPAPVDAARQSTTPEAIESAACERRTGCHLESTLRTGPASDGRDLILATVRLPALVAHRCWPQETWLLASGPGEVKRVQLVEDLCGAEGQSLPTFEALGHNRVRYTQTLEIRDDRDHIDPQEMRDIYELALDPPQITRITLRRQPTPYVRYETQWDYVGFRGETCVPALDAGSCVLRALMLPLVVVQDTMQDGRRFAADGWKEVDLGDCAMRIDGSPSGGFVTPAGSATASVRAVASGADVYLQVTDDAFVTSGPVADQIEVDIPVERDTFTDQTQVLHVSMDGVLARRQGPTGRDVVSHVEFAAPDGHTRRFRLRDILGLDTSKIRIAYLDVDPADGGGLVQQRLSSSEEGSRITATLQRVSPDDAVCVPRDNVLRVERRPRPLDPTQGMISQ
jgi:hypothetical protein